MSILCFMKGLNINFVNVIFVIYCLDPILLSCNLKYCLSDLIFEELNYVFVNFSP